MVNKHFFKTLFIFIGMIALGLTAVFLVSHFSESEEQTTGAASDVAN